MATQPIAPLPDPLESAAELLGIGAADPLSLSASVLEGFSYEALLRLSDRLEFPLASLGRCIHVSERTLARRKAEGRLHADESDRLLRIGRLFASAIRLFEGDVAEAKRWLTSKQIALGGQTPLHLAETGVGAREVENLIGRLEHGVLV